MRALVCVLSVTMPICAPVMLIALCPSEWMAIAIRATLTCSPVESSMSISRAGGWSVICLARPISRSVLSPMALTTTTTWFPSFWARIALRAAARIFWLSATLEPPNFCTMMGMAGLKVGDCPNFRPTKMGLSPCDTVSESDIIVACGGSVNRGFFLRPGRLTTFPFLLGWRWSNLTHPMVSRRGEKHEYRRQQPTTVSLRPTANL